MSVVVHIYIFLFSKKSDSGRKDDDKRWMSAVTGAPQQDSDQSIPLQTWFRNAGDEPSCLTVHEACN